MGNSGRARYLMPLLPSISIILLFLCAEFLLRITSDTNLPIADELNKLSISLGRGSADQIFTSNPDSFWKLKKNVDLSEDKDSLWGGEISDDFGNRKSFPNHSEKGKTILALGDSTVFAEGVSYQSAWPSRVEKELGINVINGGVPGYTSFQGKVHFKDLIEVHQVDYLIINFGNNDGAIWNNTSDISRYRNQQIYSFIQRSRVLLKVFEIGASFRDSSKPKKPSFLWYGNGLSKTKVGTPRVSLENYRNNLEWLIREARKDKICPMLMIWPLKNDILEGINPRARYQKVTREVARKLNVALIDLREVFLAAEFKERLYIDGIHGTDYAQKIATKKFNSFFNKEVKSLVCTN